LAPTFISARDGTRLALWDLGGSAGPGYERAGGTPVVLAHGTGLCGLCWSPFALVLARKGLRPIALDARGHGASARPAGGDYRWEASGADVLDAVDALKLGTGLVGAGHSAGATALLLAEVSRPGTFSRIWAWEPIIPTPLNRRLAELSSELAGRARRRRADFVSLDEARSYFRQRGIFAQFESSALEGFLAGGLVPAARGGLRLACSPEDEAAIYELATSLDLWPVLREAGCPVLVTGGSEAGSVPVAERERIAAELPQGAPATIDRLGHSGPFQAPDQAASQLLGWLLEYASGH
jgi:pimeloyl-ACP methyl ester carboxylesterase